MKKLLVLGGESSTVDVVKIAHELGYYVTVASRSERGEAKDLADEKILCDLEDYDTLVQYIKENNVDGVMTGPSEFHTLNMIRVCKRAGLRCYVNEEQWTQCANKELYKSNCRKHNVPCIPEFDPEKPESFRFPVVVKPVDGCSSKGISMCYNVEEFYKAKELALKYSDSGKILVEKFICNNGYGVSCWYVANQGDIRLSLFGDKYCVDTERAMISAVSISPSKLIDDYVERVNPNVIEMFKSIGVENGSLFMQAMPEEDIYFHDMGLRMSGGLIFKLTEPITGINDMRMMIRYAVGDSFSTQEEMEKVDPYLHGKYAVSFCVPLNVGTIKSIEGMEQISMIPTLTAITQYYHEGDTISEDKIGTLMQHFGRFKFVTDSYDEIIKTIEYIQNTLKIIGLNGENLIYKYFDVNRLQ